MNVMLSSYTVTEVAQRRDRGQSHCDRYHSPFYKTLYNQNNIDAVILRLKSYLPQGTSAYYTQIVKHVNVRVIAVVYIHGCKKKKKKKGY